MTPSAAETDAQAAAVANTSGITTESLTETLREKLDAEFVDINDISGTPPPVPFPPSPAHPLPPTTSSPLGPA